MVVAWEMVTGGRDKGPSVNNYYLKIKESNTRKQKL